MKRKKRSLGFVFSDSVQKINLKTKSYKNDQEDDWKEQLIPNFDSEHSQEGSEINPWKITTVQTVLLVIFFMLFVRIFHLQIVSGKINKELADGNRIQIKITHAPRGVIFDRNGKILAAASPAFRLIDEDPPADGKKSRLISREQALELEVKNDPRAQHLEVDNVRTYPMSEMMAHVIGYVGEISPQQLLSESYSDYRLGDRVGQEGIEAQYERYLRGKDGGEIIEVDSTGKKVRTLRKNSPIPGQNIYLTIDSDLQKKIYELMDNYLKESGGCCGAVVVSDPNSGQILALASFPSFNPNFFTKSEYEDKIAGVLSDPNFPILNRVTGGTYPPGSTFKIVSSLAALDSGKITPETTFLDNGVLYLGTFKFSNWYFNQYGRTEGAVNLVKALRRSNDIYFYEASIKIGKEPIIDWAKKLYLGKKLGIDLPTEVEGLVPDEEWKIKTFDTIWYPGDTLHMAIGQGFVLSTPLQILGITSYIAANGELYKPQLLDKIESRDFLARDFDPQILTSKLISENHIKTIQEGLEQVPASGGTAWPFFTFPIATAGKTGTAEYGDPDDKTHAWYTAYGPSDNPKIAMTVLIEGGGEGSSVAAPIVKEAFRWYFSEDKNNLIKDVYTPATDSGRTLGE
ncbi:MAG: penicillin-binding protein 2 [Candidatus Daviesbacteria bacterium]|nr:penicillin-binding protein 2 [Candidatus Daviesbacteria bacterium]